MDLLSVRIETRRLALVPITYDYAEPIFEHFNEEVTRYMYPKPAENINDTNAFIEESLAGMNDGSNLQLVITRKESGEFIGCAGLHHLDTDTPELGIWIKVNAQGNRFGQEAIHGLVEWARYYCKFEYLKYPVERENIASRMIPESLNATTEAEYGKTTQSGRMQDLVEYRIYP